jgi:hypothetical protein
VENGTKLALEHLISSLLVHGSRVLNTAIVLRTLHAVSQEEGERYHCDKIRLFRMRKSVAKWPYSSVQKGGERLTK